MRAGRCLTIPLNQTAAAVALWLVAASFLVAHTVTGAHMLHHWAMFTGLGASTATLAAIVNRSLRIALEVISWEHQHTRTTVATEPDAPDNVAQLRL